MSVPQNRPIVQFDETPTQGYLRTLKGQSHTPQFIGHVTKRNDGLWGRE